MTFLEFIACCLISVLVAFLCLLLNDLICFLTKKFIHKSKESEDKK